MLFLENKGVKLHVFAETDVPEEVLLIEFIEGTEDLFHNYVFVEYRVEVTVDNEDDASSLHVVMTEHFVHLSLFSK